MCVCVQTDAKMCKMEDEGGEVDNGHERHREHARIAITAVDWRASYSYPHLPTR